MLIAVVKLVAGVLANSAAMLAEAAHSFSDVGNQLLLLLGMARSEQPPSAEHPFGTSKAAYFWPFMVAILLFGVAGAYSAFEGVDKMRHPNDVGDPKLSLIVLAISFAIELASLSVALREARRAALKRGVTSVREFLRENRDASILTVIVEDALALIGLPLAAAAVLLTYWTGDPIWDGLGSVAIGLLLMGFAFFLGNQVKGLLIGRGLGKLELAKVTRIFAEDPAVARLVNLQSMHLAPEVVLLGAEIELHADVSGGQVATILRRLEEQLIDAVPSLRYVYLEPSGRSSLDRLTAPPKRPTHT